MNADAMPEPADYAIARAASCAICGGVQARHRHDWLYRCRGCGVLRSTLTGIIPERQSQSIVDEHAREAGLSTLRRRNNRGILDAIGKLRGGVPGRILDVGCAHGLFLEVAQASGHDVVGIEPDANVVSYARQKNVHVLHGFFPDILLPEDRFDVILFNDVFEHLDHPASVLTSVSRHLNPNGLVVLNCPSRRGVFFHLASFLDALGFCAPYERLWQCGLPSPHRWYFHPSDLERLGTRSNFAFCAMLRLDAVDGQGLWQRISHIEGHGWAFNAITFAGALAVLPLLHFFPSDSEVSIFRKISDETIAPKPEA